MTARQFVFALIDNKRSFCDNQNVIFLTISMKKSLVIIFLGLILLFSTDSRLSSAAPSNKMPANFAVNGAKQSVPKLPPFNANNSVAIDPVIAMSELDLFYDARSWPFSQNKKPSDTFPHLIYQIIGSYTWIYTLDKFEQTWPLTSYTSNPNAFMTTDINGDGLQDLILRDESSSSAGRGQEIEMAVWLNKGSNGYQLIYKCFVDIYRGWYGDCAAV